MTVIILMIGATKFTFDVSNAEYNKFVDRMSAGKPVQAGFNLLSSTVKQEQRATLRELIADKENQPKAQLVMSLVGEISEEMGEGMPEVVKLQSVKETSADETA